MNTPEGRELILERSRQLLFSGRKPIFMSDLPNVEWIEFVDELATLAAAAENSRTGEWECRESDQPGKSYIERGTGADTERFLDTPLPYSEAEKIEDLLNGRVKAE